MRHISQPRYAWGVVAIVCIDILFFFSLAIWRLRAYNVFYLSHIAAFVLFLIAVRSVPFVIRSSVDVDSVADRSACTCAPPSRGCSPPPESTSPTSRSAASKPGSAPRTSRRSPNSARRPSRCLHLQEVGVRVSTSACACSRDAWAGSDGRRLTHSRSQAPAARLRNAGWC